MAVSRRTPTLSIEPARATRVLAAITAALVLLSTAGQVIKFTTGHDHAKGFIPLFHVATEGNVTTYFSALLLLSAAGLLAWIGWREREREGRFAAHWLGLSVIFAYLSIDEAAALHEKAIIPVRELLDTSGVLYFAWIIPAGVLLVVLAVLYLRFYLELPGRSRRLFGLAALLFVGGAVGMEMLGGMHYEQYGDQTVVYSTLTTIEEAMEMAGIIVLIHGLLVHIGSQMPRLRARIGAPEPG